jgi:hypothetical protein
MADDRPKFNVPRQELPFFKQLVSTTPETLKTLTEALAKQPPSLDVDKLAMAVAKDANVEESVAQQLLQLVWRLTMVQRRLELSAEDFVNSLAAGLDTLPNDEWSAEDRAGWAKVIGPLEELLTSDTAATSSAKASELLFDQQLGLCSSRIITETRAVFDDSAQTIKGILLFHTLVLRCHEGSNNRDIYIALDSNDLILLREQLERAERKEKVLQNTLQSAGLKVIDVSNDTDI